jgi:glycosyltransferase involved in cell wall biosynthesis
LYRVALGHRNLRVIFQNEDDRASVSALARLPPERSTVIRGSGVDLESFRYHEPEGGRTPVVMLACRWLADKGVREFCEAARALRARAAQGAGPARFVLVGDTDPGNPASLTMDELRKYADEGSIELWGRRADMPAVLAEADIVVLPSYREGLPKVLLEAAACGRPVVTTDVPGCRDAIEPGVTGVLVPVRDAGALADAIDALLHDPARRLEMGRAGRQLAERCFDVRQVVEEHLRIYDQLLRTAGA